MPTFSYSARPAAGGEMQSGELNVATKEEVLAHLHRQKLIPVSVREKPKELSLSFGSGVTTRDIVIFTRQFATMINSGLPLVQSLDILAEQTERTTGRWTGDQWVVRLHIGLEDTDDIKQDLAAGVERWAKAA